MAENPEEVPEENSEENSGENPGYLCLKVPLKKILLSKENVLTIEDAVLRTHRIVIKAYQLVRLWSLKKVEEAEKRGKKKPKKGKKQKTKKGGKKKTKAKDEIPFIIKKQHFMHAFKVIHLTPTHTNNPFRCGRNYTVKWYPASAG